MFRRFAYSESLFFVEVKNWLYLFAAIPSFLLFTGCNSISELDLISNEVDKKLSITHYETRQISVLSNLEDLKTIEIRIQGLQTGAYDEDSFVRALGLELLGLLEHEYQEPKFGKVSFVLIESNRTHFVELTDVNLQIFLNAYRPLRKTEDLIIANKVLGFRQNLDSSVFQVEESVEGLRGLLAKTSQECGVIDSTYLISADLSGDSMFFGFCRFRGDIWDDIRYTVNSQTGLIQDFSMTPACDF